MSAVVDLSLECFSVHIITGWVESSFLRHTRGDMYGQYFHCYCVHCDIACKWKQGLIESIKPLVAVESEMIHHLIGPRPLLPTDKGQVVNMLTVQFQPHPLFLGAGFVTHYQDLVGGKPGCERN